jgi:hypothetical protein
MWKTGKPFPVCARRGSKATASIPFLSHVTITRRRDLGWRIASKVYSQVVTVRVGARKTGIVSGHGYAVLLMAHNSGLIECDD